MPTILRAGPYRFFFYSSDGNEPVHVHVEREDKVAKIWVDPIWLSYSGGFNRAEIARILKIIGKNKTQIMEAWDEYFSN
ncbi:MAG: DUF4160 domain-containing protein [Desulfobulbaceae bacterium]|uniref:DUF4160 domain-containing protein n=1 Tax=Candidatus Desulfobia pelagia TaxID=2841692 RepID=A0A8J6TD46_9BACT|nr:DUF4160 domain-containing protein [Candidatus Desulfobia pelagia]